jgi:hypothetical protein
MTAVTSPELEIARQQWQSAARRLEAARDDPRRYRRLHEQVDSVLSELRRRLGQTYTLAELVDAYNGAEAWALDAIEARDSEPGWQRDVALVTDAAFGFYARGASDYRP